MASSAFRIHGAGHGLLDFIHSDIDFASSKALQYHAQVPGDGGLEMGKVLNLEAFLRYAGKPWENVLADLTAMVPADVNAAVSAKAMETGRSGIPEFNAGGPGLVSMAVASQLLKPAKVPVTYYGLSGDDSAGSRLRHLLAQTPLDMTCFRQRPGRTATTMVCNDPRAQQGHGDRFFLNDPGTVACDASILGESFFQATFNVYAGTAMVPALHAELPALLAKGRHRGALNVVATVFDSVSEKSAPGRPWSLGAGEAYPDIDLLVANAEEIRRLAGLSGVEECVSALFARGLTAAVVTRGPGEVYYRSRGGIFGRTEGYAPANPALVAMAGDRSRNSGDTSGAGDNFLAGLLSDLMLQILSDDFFPKGEIHIERELLQICPLRLRHAIEFGIVAGGLACLQKGGLKIEKSKGERLNLVRTYFPDSVPAGRPW